MEQNQETRSKPTKYGQMIFNKEAKVYQRGKNGLSTNGAMITGCPLQQHKN